MKYPGMKEVNRCKLLTEEADYPRYLAIYKFESEDSFKKWQESPELKAARAEMEETWKTDKFEIRWRRAYSILKTWRR